MFTDIYGSTLNNHISKILLQCLFLKNVFTFVRGDSKRDMELTSAN